MKLSVKTAIDQYGFNPDSLACSTIEALVPTAPERMMCNLQEDRSEFVLRPFFFIGLMTSSEGFVTRLPILFTQFRRRGFENFTEALTLGKNYLFT